MAELRYGQVDTADRDGQGRPVIKLLAFTPSGAGREMPLSTDDALRLIRDLAAAIQKVTR